MDGIPRSPFRAPISMPSALPSTSNPARPAHRPPFIPVSVSETATAAWEGPLAAGSGLHAAVCQRCRIFDVLTIGDSSSSCQSVLCSSPEASVGLAHQQSIGHGSWSGPCECQSETSLSLVAGERFSMHTVGTTPHRHSEVEQRRATGDISNPPSHEPKTTHPIGTMETCSAYRKPYVQPTGRHRCSHM